MDIQTIFFAALGGIVPALVWVWFWNQEDKKNPEPKGLIALAFFAGMVCVAMVIPFQKLTMVYLSGTMMIIVWAAIEEVCKFALAYITVLRNRANDEPIDALVYMITIALGFAAAENALFLIAPIMQEGFTASILTGNFRFLGATLLHVLASSVVGVALAIAFYRSKKDKWKFGIIGLILAVALHSTFNLLILNTSSEYLLRIFAFVWLGLVALLIAFEYIKKIKKRL